MRLLRLNRAEPELQELPEPEPLGEASTSAAARLKRALEIMMAEGTVQLPQPMLLALPLLLRSPDASILTIMRAVRDVCNYVIGPELPALTGPVEKEGEELPALTGPKLSGEIRIRTSDDLEALR